MALWQTEGKRVKIKTRKSYEAGGGGGGGVGEPPENHTL